MNPQHPIPVLAVLACMALPGSLPAITLGQPAPDFLVENVQNGEGFSMSEHAGRIVVLVFFAHW